ncbi:MAG: hypothetical protein GY853_00995 [PVC group bacterium]|nr:hypothetical protein [PVC group bacterium]
MSEPMKKTLLDYIHEIDNKTIELDEKLKRFINFTHYYGRSEKEGNSRKYYWGRYKE